MSLRRTSRWTGRGGSLDAENRSTVHETRKPRSHEGKGSNVGWLFLDPNNFPCARVSFDLLCNLRLGPRIHLFQRCDRSRVVFLLLPLRSQFMPNLACTKDQTLGILDFRLRQDVLER